MAPLVRRALERGAWGTAEAVLDRAVEAAIGVRTSQFVSPEDAGVAAPNRVWHAASGWIPVWRAMRALRPAASDVLLDYGAGKGRALLVASRSGFGRVLGVEVSSILAAEAQDNLRRRRGGGSPWEVVVADAAEWDVPADVTVVYMYCPFTGPLFARAMDRLLASIDRTPRRARLVYNTPFEHNYLLGTGRFKPVAVTTWPPFARRRRRSAIVTYEVLAAPVTDAAGDPERLGEWAGRRDTSSLMPGEFDSLSA